MPPVVFESAVLDHELAGTGLGPAGQVLAVPERLPVLGQSRHPQLNGEHRQRNRAHRWNPPVPPLAGRARPGGGIVRLRGIAGGPDGAGCKPPSPELRSLFPGAGGTADHVASSRPDHLGVCGVLAASCSGKAASRPADEGPRRVQVVKAERRRIPRTVVAVGTLAAEERAELGFKVAGPARALERRPRQPRRRGRVAGRAGRPRLRAAARPRARRPRAGAGAARPARRGRRRRRRLAGRGHRAPGQGAARAGHGQPEPQPRAARPGHPGPGRLRRHRGRLQGGAEPLQRLPRRGEQPPRDPRRAALRPGPRRAAAPRHAAARALLGSGPAAARQPRRVPGRGRARAHPGEAHARCGCAWTCPSARPRTSARGRTWRCASRATTDAWPGRIVRAVPRARGIEPLAHRRGGGGQLEGPAAPRLVRPGRDRDRQRPGLAGRARLVGGGLRGHREGGHGEGGQGPRAARDHGPPHRRQRRGPLGPRATARRWW